jgi:hypothetical protein
MRLSIGVRLFPVILALAAVSGLAVPAARADEKWHHLGELQAGKEPAEVTVNREISKVRIICKAETLVINTVVVREGAAKTPIEVAKKFAKDEEYVVDLGGRKMVTGLRISNPGTGRYLLSVR